MRHRPLWRTITAIAYHKTRDTIRHKLFAVPKMLLANNGFYSKPNFLIIGAQKCGTTSLHHYLCEHPDLFRSKKKEIEYFSNDKRYKKGKYSYYHSHFPPLNKLPINGVVYEATPEYIYNPKCATRIYDYNPSIKLILLVRNPVDRAFSAWNFYRRMHERITFSNFYLRLKEINPSMKKLLCTEQYPSFEELIEKEIEKINNEPKLLLSGILQRGMYAVQINNYLRYFNKNQLLIIDNLELKTRPKMVLDRIADFLGLRPFDWSWHKNERKQVGSYNTLLKSATRSSLSAFFAPHNEMLYHLLDRDFGW